jgi:hypothetical protein
MVVILKIPLAAALYLIWYAIRQEPAPEGEEISDDTGGPRRKPPSGPRPRRRGPAGGAGCRPVPCPELGGARLPRYAPAFDRR